MEIKKDSTPWKWSKLAAGLLLVFYPIAQAYLRGKGIDIDDLGDFTAKAQILGAAILAQTSKVIRTEPDKSTSKDPFSKIE